MDILKLMDLILARQSVTKQAACQHIMHCCSKCKGPVSYCRCMIPKGKSHIKQYDSDPSKCGKCTPKNDWLANTIAKRLAKEKEDGDTNSKSAGNIDRIQPEEPERRVGTHDRLGTTKQSQLATDNDPRGFNEERHGSSTATTTTKAASGQLHTGSRLRESNEDKAVTAPTGDCSAGSAGSLHSLGGSIERHEDTEIKSANEGPIAGAKPITKQAKFAPVKVQDSCKKCKNPVTLSTCDVDGSDHVDCDSCKEKNFVLMSDEDKKAVIEAAATDTATAVSQEQRHAGNYQKGKFNISDLTIAIENPKGSIRRGVSKSGHKWETELKDHYGYILKYKSEADGDHMDVFIAAEPDFTNRNVYVVDQKVRGEFDEHKCIFFAKDAEDAKKIYQRNYQASWDGFSGLSTLSFSEFVRWLRSGDSHRALFVKTPASDADTVRQTLELCSKKAKEKDPSGDVSGGYGSAVLCKRQGKCYLVCGDWWSKEIIDIYKKELGKALPQYLIEVEAESLPNGYESKNMGDWAKVQ